MRSAGCSVRLFPQEPYDAWRGSGREIVNRLVQLIDWADEGGGRLLPRPRDQPHPPHLHTTRRATAILSRAVGPPRQDGAARAVGRRSRRSVLAASRYRRL
jgi:hypothetical protein